MAETKRINKGDLVEAIAKETELPKAKVDQVIKSFTTTVQKNLVKGNSVVIPGFGTWSVKKVAARKGRNIQTGEAIKIKATKRVKFKAGATVTDAVKGIKKK